MSKTIIYCADGTWNGAGTRELLEADKPELSNVYRIFQRLRGTPVLQLGVTIGLRVEQKDFRQFGKLLQTAMYCHGVGENEHDLEEHIVGGAFGGGLTTRIRMGYAFVSRQYEPGDRIVLVGFSRGAYTARALADFIATQGVLQASDAGSHLPFSPVAGAWLAFRKATRAIHASTKLGCLIAGSEDLHYEALKFTHRIPDSSRYRTATVAAVAVFDTVGSVGIPDIELGVVEDDFQFVNANLLPGIERAFHAVSLDEQRMNFRPTLWLPSVVLTQTLFAGAHSDVGGGYDDHELADVPLQWMSDNLEEFVAFEPEGGEVVSRNPLGLAHRPWIGGLASFGAAPRAFTSSIAVSGEIHERIAATAVPLEKAASAVPYRPTNLPVCATRCRE